MATLRAFAIFVAFLGIVFDALELPKGCCTYSRPVRAGRGRYRVEIYREPAESDWDDCSQAPSGRVPFTEFLSRLAKNLRTNSPYRIGKYA